MTTTTDTMIAEKYLIDDTQEWATVECEVRFNNSNIKKRYEIELIQIQVFRWEDVIRCQCHQHWAAEAEVAVAAVCVE